MSHFVLHVLPVPATELPVPLLFAVQNNRFPNTPVYFVLVKWMGCLNDSLVAGPFVDPPTVGQSAAVWLGSAEVHTFRFHANPDCTFTTMFATASCHWVGGAYVLPDSRVSFFTAAAAETRGQEENEYCDCSDLRWTIGAMRPNPFASLESQVRSDVNDDDDDDDDDDGGGGGRKKQDAKAKKEAERRMIAKLLKARNWSKFIVQDKDMQEPRKSMLFDDLVTHRIARQKKQHANHLTLGHPHTSIDKNYVVPIDLQVAYSASVGRVVCPEHMQHSNYTLNTYLFTKRKPARQVAGASGAAGGGCVNPAIDSITMPVNVVALRFALFQDANMVEVTCDHNKTSHRCWLNYNLIADLARIYPQAKSSSCLEVLRFAVHGNADGTKRTLMADGTFNLQSNEDFIAVFDKEVCAADDGDDDGDDDADAELVIGPDTHTFEMEQDREQEGTRRLRSAAQRTKKARASGGGKK